MTFGKLALEGNNAGGACSGPSDNALQGLGRIDSTKTTASWKPSVKTAWQQDDHSPHWHYPGALEQSGAAAPGRAARLPGRLLQHPKGAIASLVASSLLSNQKTAGIVVTAFCDELRKMAAALR